MPQTVTRPAKRELLLPPIPKVNHRTAVERLNQDVEEGEKLNEQIEVAARIREADRTLEVSM